MEFLPFYEELFSAAAGTAYDHKGFVKLNNHVWAQIMVVSTLGFYESQSSK